MKKLFQICWLVLASIGVYVVIKGNTNGGNSYDPIWKVGVTTTNTTPSNIFTYPIPVDGQVLRFTVDVLAKSGSDAFSGRKKCTILRSSGALTIIGVTAQDIVASVNTTGLAAVTWTITTSGTNVLVQVTGLTSTTIAWEANITNLTLD